jgi:Zn-dependent protease
MKQKELDDLAISAVVIAVAFGIAYSGGYSAFSNPRSLTITCLMALVGVSTGFILHELGHRFMARRFQCVAQFVMSPFGLLIALASSMFGFVFAAPGAVQIFTGYDQLGNPTLTRERHGQISLTGPAINIGLSLVFMLMNIIFPNALCALGAYINSWLAVFNLIPFGPLDGRAVFNWRKSVWLVAMALGIGLFILQLQH